MLLKKDKQNLIENLIKNFKSAQGYFLVSLLNLKTSFQFKLRAALKKNNASFQVVKKSLVYKAKPDFPFSDEELKKPFAFIWDFSENLSGLRSLKEFRKDGFNLEILGGFLDNKKILGREVEEIINLPSKGELNQKLVFSLKKMLFSLNYNLKFPLQRLIFVLSAIKNKNN